MSSRGLELRVESRNSQLCCLLQTPRSQTGLNNSCPAPLKGVPADKKNKPSEMKIISYFLLTSSSWPELSLLILELKINLWEQIVFFLPLVTGEYMPGKEQNICIWPGSARGELPSRLLLSDSCLHAMQVVLYVKEEMKRNDLPETAVIGLLWTCIMNAVEWNKKEELVAEQALKHLKVPDWEQSKLQANCSPSQCDRWVLSVVCPDSGQTYYFLMFFISNLPLPKMFQV